MEGYGSLKFFKKWVNHLSYRMTKKTFSRVDGTFTSGAFVFQQQLIFIFGLRISLAKNLCDKFKKEM